MSLTELTPFNNSKELLVIIMLSSNTLASSAILSALINSCKNITHKILKTAIEIITFLPYRM